MGNLGVALFDSAPAGTATMDEVIDLISNNIPRDLHWHRYAPDAWNGSTQVSYHGRAFTLASLQFTVYRRRGNTYVSAQLTGMAHGDLDRNDRDLSRARNDARQRLHPILEKLHNLPGATTAPAAERGTFDIS